MKNIKRLLLVLVFAIMIIPFAIKAESNKVTIYLFRGEGCPHCEEALEWFDGLDQETKNKINLVQYETWKDTTNAELMHKVAQVFGEDNSNLGVPYIVIGDKTFIGFATTSQDQILNRVNELYGQENVYDVMEHIGEAKKDTTDNDKAAVKVIIIFFIVAAGAVLIYYVSKSK